MSKVRVKNEARMAGCSLCESCTHAHIISGYRETEALVFCNFAWEQAIPVPFKVRECSNYTDRTRPTWEEMKDLALQIQPASSSKPAGFRLAQGKTREEPSTTETMSK